MMLINGEVREEISAQDRGLHFGDGVFETVAVDTARALCLDRHIRRLGEGCRRLAIAPPAAATLEEECARICDGVERGVLKIMVTRGIGGRGYAPGEGASPTRIVARYPWPAYPASARSRGVAVRVCRTRLGRNARLAGIKHLNRLEQVLARSEEDASGCAEGIMLDEDGRVIEGVMSNVFMRHGRVLTTPDLSACGVAGIMRELVLESAATLEGIEPRVGAMSVDDLSSADECFLTNSLIGIWPINRLQGQAIEVGPLAHTLQSLLVESGAMTRD